MRNGIPRIFIYKRLFGTSSKNAVSWKNASSYGMMPARSCCVNLCKQFLTYPVTTGVGEFNGQRIIPIGVECLNIPGKICCADAIFINPQILPSGSIQKPSLFECESAGVFEERRYPLKKYPYPIFIPRDWVELDAALEKYSDKVNPDGQIDRSRQIELLIEELAKFQAFRNWDKIGKVINNAL